MQQFQISLKNDKTKIYHLIASLLVLLNLAVFIFLLISGMHFYEAAAALLLSVIYIMYHYHRAEKNVNLRFVDHITFFILAGCWLALQNYLLAFACASLGIMYHLSLQKLQFVFSNHFVKKMNFPQKAYSWEMFSNVMLRDNILTLDLKNNKLIQLETEDHIDEIQFNEFARQHLPGSRDSRETSMIN